MRKIIIVLFVLLGVQFSMSAQSGKIIQSDGLFFTDNTQTKLYTGEYKVFPRWLYQSRDIHQKWKTQCLSFISKWKTKRGAGLPEWRVSWKRCGERTTKPGCWLHKPSTVTTKNTVSGTCGTIRALCVTRWNMPTGKKQEPGICGMKKGN